MSRFFLYFTGSLIASFIIWYGVANATGIVEEDAFMTVSLSAGNEILIFGKCDVLNSSQINIALIVDAPSTASTTLSNSLINGIGSSQRQQHDFTTYYSATETGDFDFYYTANNGTEPYPCADAGGKATQIGYVLLPTGSGGSGGTGTTTLDLPDDFYNGIWLFMALMIFMWWFGFIVKTFKR